MRKYSDQEWRLDGVREWGSRFLSVAKLCERDLNGEYLVLDKEEQRELAQKYQRDGLWEDRDNLVFSTVFWVYKIAHIYARRYQAKHLFWDLVQEGMIGVMVAAEKYAPARGFAFSTYCTYWIKQKMGRFLIYELEAVRLPVYMVDSLRKLKKFQSMLAKRLEREPTDSELASEMGEKTKKVRWMRSLKSSNRMVSVDKPLRNDDGDGDMTILDTLFKKDDHTIVFEALAQAEILGKLRRFIENNFAKKRAFVAVHRLGLNGSGDMTLEEVAEVYGERFGKRLTRERIRQLESKVLSDGRLRWFAAKLLLENGVLLSGEKSEKGNGKAKPLPTKIMYHPDDPDLQWVCRGRRPNWLRDLIREGREPVTVKL